jgi:ADP-ribose pyrophosphatase
MPSPESTEPTEAAEPLFRKLGEQLRYKGSLITVESATFGGPDGGTFERDVVHHPGAVSVVPLVDDQTAVLLVRQFRAAVERDLLEIPAGKRDKSGEPPEATAQRELEEEVGMRAGRLAPLARFYNSPGFSDELSFSFLAFDLEPAQIDPQGIEEQQMTVVKVGLDSVPGLIASGAICDAKTIIGLCLALRALGR